MPEADESGGLVAQAREEHGRRRLLRLVLLDEHLVPCSTPRQAVQRCQ